MKNTLIKTILQTFCHCFIFTKEKTENHGWQKLSRTRGFIDRTPVRFIGGAFILIVGILAKSYSLAILGLYDLIISFLFFYDPDIQYKKSFKLPVLVLYGAILLWCAMWLFSKFPA